MKLWDYREDFESVEKNCVILLGLVSNIPFLLQF